MMNRIWNSAALAAVLVAGGVLGSAQKPATTEENASTTNNIVRLGEHPKLTAQPAERDRIRPFYQGVLGCKLNLLSERLDSFQIEATFNIGVVYDSSSLSPSDISKGIWLELQTDDPEELKARIHFGIRATEYFDKKHFYFEASGGQVFRPVMIGEVF